MSIRQIAECFYTRTFRTAGQRLTAIALADFADDHGRAWPSLATIADKTGYSRRQTQRIVHQLEEIGYVEIIIDATWNKTPLYLLHPEALEARHPHATPTDDPREHEHISETLSAQDATRGDTMTPPGDDTDDTPGVTPATGRGDTGDTQSVSEPSPDPSPEIEEADVSRETSTAEIERFTDTTPQEETPRPRNRAWDALATIFEYMPEGSEQALWGKISREAHEAAADPDKGTGDPGMEVLMRADRMIRQWGAKSLTPPSLLKHWKRFGTRLGAATEEEVERVRDTWDREERRRRMADLENDPDRLEART